MALSGFWRPDESRIHLSAAWPWQEVILQKLEQGLCAQRIYQDLREPKPDTPAAFTVCGAWCRS